MCLREVSGQFYTKILSFSAPSPVLSGFTSCFLLCLQHYLFLRKTIAPGRGATSLVPLSPLVAMHEDVAKFQRKNNTIRTFSGSAKTRETSLWRATSICIFFLLVDGSLELLHLRSAESQCFLTTA